MPDAVTQRLADGASDVTRIVRILSATEIRSRGDRRRLAVTASFAAAAVVLATLGGVFYGMGVPDADRPGPGAPITASHAAPSASPPPASPPPASAWTLEIPDKVAMPHEDESGWQRNDNKNITSVFTGCGATDPTKRGRTDARTMTGPVNPAEGLDSAHQQTEHLFLYENPAAALAALAALRAGVTACGWIDPQMRDQLDGTHLISDVPPERESVSGFQVGNAIFIHYVKIGKFELTTGADTDQSAMAYTLCAMMRLCGAAMVPWPDMSARPSTFR